LYDLQWRHPDEMLAASPTTGAQVGFSFMIPHRSEDSRRISHNQSAGEPRSWTGAASGALSGVVATVTEADLKNIDIADDIKRYFQAARAETYDRLSLFRLAWDATLSAFSARQIQYERFFVGDPVRLAGMIFGTHDRRPYMDQVYAFLKKMREEGLAGQERL
jgi:4-hydroxyphenylacetate 3-hydroxylase C terminal